MAAIDPNADFVSETCSLSVPRIYLPVPLHSGAGVTLDARAAQHVAAGASCVAFVAGDEGEATS